VRVRLGGFDVNATPLKDLTLLTMDVAAIAVDIDFHPQYKTLVYVSPTEEDCDQEFADELGEEYFALAGRRPCAFRAPASAVKTGTGWVLIPA
jgi:hypothetical protein